MCVSTDNSTVRNVVGLATGTGLGSLFGNGVIGGDRSHRGAKRTFANAEGQQTVRLRKARYESVLASPEAIQGILATGKPPRGKTMLGG